MSFIEKLDSLMEERHINKATLAREAGIPYTTIDGFYKKGSDNIKLSTLRKLSAYFHCTLDYLTDDMSDDLEKSEHIEKAAQTEPTYEDVERLVARNGKNLTTEQKMRLIKLLSEIE